jgi:hypothetical protein
MNVSCHSDTKAGMVRRRYLYNTLSLHHLQDRAILVPMVLYGRMPRPVPGGTLQQALYI